MAKDKSVLFVVVAHVCVTSTLRAMQRRTFNLAWAVAQRCVPRRRCWNRWTGWWNTTTHHDLHHSSGNTNFGLYFTWWDRWMGTEHPRYREEFRKVTARTRKAAREAGAAPA